MKQPADENILCADQVAARIGIGRRQIYEAVARNAIPHQRVGQRILFYWPALVAWLSGGGGELAAYASEPREQPEQAAARALS